MQLVKDWQIAIILKNINDMIFKENLCSIGKYMACQTYTIGKTV